MIGRKPDSRIRVMVGKKKARSNWWIDSLLNIRRSTGWWRKTMDAHTSDTWCWNASSLYCSLWLSVPTWLRFSSNTTQTFILSNCCPRATFLWASRIHETMTWRWFPPSHDDACRTPCSCVDEHSCRPCFHVICHVNPFYLGARITVGCCCHGDNWTLKDAFCCHGDVISLWA